MKNLIIEALVIFGLFYGGSCAVCALADRVTKSVSGSGDAAHAPLPHPLHSSTSPTPTRDRGAGTWKPRAVGALGRPLPAPEHDGDAAS